MTLRICNLFFSTEIISIYRQQEVSTEISKTWELEAGSSILKSDHLDSLFSVLKGNLYESEFNLKTPRKDCWTELNRMALFLSESLISCVLTARVEFLWVKEWEDPEHHAERTDHLQAVNCHGWHFSKLLEDHIFFQEEIEIE